MAFMKGKWQGIEFLVRTCVLCVLFGCLLGPASAADLRPADPVAGDQQDDPVDLDKLRSMLDKSGPEGRTDRERAVTQLLTIAKPEAHLLLQERLWRKQDPDGLRLTILTAMQGHLLLSKPKQFGGATDSPRQLILIGYLDACARFWSGADDVV
ncbi:MAG: hypothetical protein ACI9S9_004991, partial [Planctomycetota bacterium]